tara:strand:- start:23183 stop:23617 length:435 start_codon:yes stop_codon:yes gene_type:complete
MWTLVLGKLFGIGETWVEAKTKQATAQVENKIALDQATTQAAITVKQKDADATNDIDLISVKNQRFTWTDEYIKVIFTLPFILMFLPWTQEHVISGFESFTASTPEWYKYVIYAIVVSELGMRRMFMKLFDLLSTLRTGKSTNG